MHFTGSPNVRTRSAAARDLSSSLPYQPAKKTTLELPFNAAKKRHCSAVSTDVIATSFGLGLLALSHKRHAPVKQIRVSLMALVLSALCASCSQQPAVTPTPATITIQIPDAATNFLKPKFITPNPSHHYEIIGSPGGSTRHLFLLDRLTGRTWQYYQFTNSKASQPGWVPLHFDPRPGSIVSVHELENLESLLEKADTTPTLTAEEFLAFTPDDLFAGTNDFAFTNITLRTDVGLLDLPTEITLSNAIKAVRDAHRAKTSTKP